MAFRSGFVSIIGRPNAGKSTLLNALVGEKIAIVTAKPQTTRNRIQGMLNLKSQKGRPAGQIIFIDTPGVLEAPGVLETPGVLDTPAVVDTPGVHKADGRLNRSRLNRSRLSQSRLSRKMTREIHDALESRDLVLLVVDAGEKFSQGDEQVLDIVRKSAGPVFLLLNKVDKVKKERLLPLIEHYSKLHQFQEVIPISATRQEGLGALVDKIVRALPEGPRYFPEDQLTDQPERFLAAEIIREKVLLQTGEEVPYASAVVVESYEELPKLSRISATIYCEREGQKGILIGKGGDKLKKIGTSARHELEQRLNKKIFLELFVKVRPGWRQSAGFVEDLDWRRQLEHLAGKKQGQ